MAKRKAIIHRYDNLPDIEAVERNGCTEVYQRARDDNFELVIVIPTGRARTNRALVAEATSGQYKPVKSKSWPGRPDMYPIRIDVKNARYTNIEQIKSALDKAGESWHGSWVIKSVEVEESDLFEGFSDTPPTAT